MNIKNCILEFYRKSTIGKIVLEIPRRIYKVILVRFLGDKAWCLSMFIWTHGYRPDLDNPQTLNEKIQWLKLYNRNPDFTNWADKYKVRDNIRVMFGEKYLIPLLAVSADPRSIDFAVLPEPFIIKSTHSSGQTIIVSDKCTQNWSNVVRQSTKWLKSNLYREGREWHYRDIPPRIVVEKLLLDESGNIPTDYKIHCVNGDVVAIQVDIDRYSDHRRNFYDVNWTLLPFDWSVCVGDKPLWPQGRDIEKPSVLPELIEMSKQIATNFSYVRVDWYVVANEIFFGEVTLHHGGGYERILPFEWDKKLGELLQLPKVDSINVYNITEKRTSS